MTAGSGTFEAAVAASRDAVIEWLEVPTDEVDAAETAECVRVALSTALPHLLAPLRELADEQRIADGTALHNLLDRIESEARP